MGSIDYPAVCWGLVRRTGDDPRRGLFREYFKDPDTTARAWLDNWFHTGDVVCEEGDGSFTFVEREKHMIRRGGQNVAAAEVEACLLRHASVMRVAAVAMPDELRQEEVFACIAATEPPTDPEWFASEVLGHALERSAYFKVPGWIAFVKELPTTATHKTRRSKSLETIEDLLVHAEPIDLRQAKQLATRRRKAEAT